MPAQLGSDRRLRLIFDVNTRVSYASGHWEQIQRNKERRPYLRYVAVMDRRTRPAHRAWHGTILPVDHPWWETHYPPCGWNCRCTVVQLSERDLVRYGFRVSEGPPRDPPGRAWTNRRTGVMQQVPYGIDPGWAYNPGKAGARAATAYADKLIDAPPALAAAAIAGGRDALVEPLAAEFGLWVDKLVAGQAVDRSTYTVGALSQRVLDFLAGKGLTPDSGAITIQQQVVGHAERAVKQGLGTAVAPDDLKRLPQILAAPRAIYYDREDPALLYVYDAGDEQGRAGKIVVRVNYSIRVPKPGGGRQQVVANSVRTAGLVDQATDLDGVARYEQVM